MNDDARLNSWNTLIRVMEAARDAGAVITHVEIRKQPGCGEMIPRTGSIALQVRGGGEWLPAQREAEPVEPMQRISRVFPALTVNDVGGR